MKTFQQIYFELLHQKYSTDELAKSVDNALRYYGDDNIANVLDIGFGIGENSLYFASKDINVTALDSDIENVKYLTKRKNEKSLDNLRIFSTHFDEDFNPDQKFSLVILSNIIHFWEITKTQSILNFIDEKLLENNGLLLLKFHSKRWEEILNKIDRKHSFSHFYDPTEIDQILTEKYKKVFQLTLERRFSSVEWNIQLEAYLKFARQTNPQVTEETAREWLKFNELVLGEDNVTLIYKKI